MYKRSILFGRGNSTHAVYKATPNRSGVRDHKRNKHQLLHRIQSVRTFTNLQYLFPWDILKDKSVIFFYIQYNLVIVHKFGQSEDVRYTKFKLIIPTAVCLIWELKTTIPEEFLFKIQISLDYYAVFYICNNNN